MGSAKPKTLPAVLRDGMSRSTLLQKLRMGCHKSCSSVPTVWIYCVPDNLVSNVSLYVTVRICVQSEPKHEAAAVDFPYL